MKTIYFLTLLLFVFGTSAAEVFTIKPFAISIQAPNVMKKIEVAIENPEGVLRRYTPVGGKIKNKEVSRNQVSFDMTKKVLILNTTFSVKITIDIKANDKICPNDQTGYVYAADLAGSDGIVYDNIDSLKFQICIKPVSSTEVTANVSGVLVKGRGYTEPVGSIAKNTIEDQVDPFVEAIKEEVLSTK